MTVLIIRTLIVMLTVSGLRAQAPQLINFQGRVAVNGLEFTGLGQFKFALVDAAGATSYWSNDGTSNAGGEPVAAVTIAVSSGQYAVLLGDTNVPNMTAIPPMCSAALSSSCACGSTTAPTVRNFWPRTTGSPLPLPQMATQREASWRLAQDPGTSTSTERLPSVAVTTARCGRGAR